MNVKRIINAGGPGALQLGRQGENAVTEVVFPVLADPAGGTWTLNHRRATDAAAYPVPLETRGNTLVWTVTAGDTANPGHGYAELTYYGETGEIMKSRIYATNVLKSLETGGEVPDAVEPWYEKLLEAIEDVGAAPEETAMDTLAALVECGLISPAGNGQGGVYTNNGKVLVL